MSVIEHSLSMAHSRYHTVVLAFSMQCVRYESSRSCHDVRPSVCLSVRLMGVCCDHVVCVNADLNLWLDSPLF